MTSPKEFKQEMDRFLDGWRPVLCVTKDMEPVYDVEQFALFKNDLDALLRRFVERCCKAICLACRDGDEPQDGGADIYYHVFGHDA